MNTLNIYKIETMTKGTAERHYVAAPDIRKALGTIEFSVSPDIVTLADLDRKNVSEHTIPEDVLRWSEEDGYVAEMKYGMVIK